MNWFEQEMKIDELELGDIVLFFRSPPSSRFGMLDALISHLDRVPFAHAAIVVGVANEDHTVGPTDAEGSEPARRPSPRGEVVIVHSLDGGRSNWNLREQLLSEQWPEVGTFPYVVLRVGSAEQRVAAALEARQQAHHRANHPYPFRDLVLAAVHLSAKNVSKLPNDTADRVAAAAALAAAVDPTADDGTSGDATAPDPNLMCAAFIAGCFDPATFGAEIEASTVAPPVPPDALFDDNLAEMFGVAAPDESGATGTGGTGSSDEALSAWLGKLGLPDWVVHGLVSAATAANDSGSSSLDDVRELLSTVRDRLVVHPDEFVGYFDPEKAGSSPSAPTEPHRLWTIGRLVRDEKSTVVGFCRDWGSDASGVVDLDEGDDLGTVAAECARELIADAIAAAGTHAGLAAGEVDEDPDGTFDAAVERLRESWPTGTAPGSSGTPVATSDETRAGIIRAIEILARGEVVPFVGAGAARDPAIGAPSWEQLIERLARRLPEVGHPWPTTVDRLRSPQARAQSIALNLGGWFSSALLDELGALVERLDRTTPTYEAVHGLRPKRLVTTNYDHGAIVARLAACRDDLSQRDRIRFGAFTVPGDDRPQRRRPGGAEPPYEILHLHGSIVRPSSLVLTISQYAERYQVHPSSTADLMSQLWVDEQLFFIGFGMQDDFIEAELARLTSGLAIERRRGDRALDPRARHARERHVAFVSGSDRVDPVYLRDVWCAEIIRYPVLRQRGKHHHDVLLELLEQLRAALPVEPVGTTGRYGSDVSGEDVAACDDVPEGSAFSAELEARRPILIELVGDEAGREARIEALRSELLSEPAWQLEPRARRWRRLRGLSANWAEFRRALQDGIGLIVVEPSDGDVFRIAADPAARRSGGRWLADQSMAQAIRDAVDEMLGPMIVLSTPEPVADFESLRGQIAFVERVSPVAAANEVTAESGSEGEPPQPPTDDAVGLAVLDSSLPRALLERLGLESPELEEAWVDASDDGEWVVLEPHLARALRADAPQHEWQDTGDTGRTRSGHGPGNKDGHDAKEGGGVVDGPDPSVDSRYEEMLTWIERRIQRVAAEFGDPDAVLDLDGLVWHLLHTQPHLVPDLIASWNAIDGGDGDEDGERGALADAATALSFRPERALRNMAHRRGIGESQDVEAVARDLHDHLDEHGSSLAERLDRMTLHACAAELAVTLPEPTTTDFAWYAWELGRRPRWRTTVHEYPLDALRDQIRRVAGLADRRAELGSVPVESAVPTTLAQPSPAEAGWSDHVRLVHDLGLRLRHHDALRQLELHYGGAVRTMLAEAVQRSEPFARRGVLAGRRARQIAPSGPGQS